MNCLEEYLQIFKQYPLIDKRLKNERNRALRCWRVNEADYSRLKKEACRFIRENRNVINPVFIEKAVCPLISDCLMKKEYDFMNDLIRTIGVDGSQKISLKTVIDIYCEYIHREKSPIQIVDEILSYSVSDPLLELKLELMQDQIQYSIHELPIGIIETDVLSMQNYCNFFNEYEEVSKKLNKSTNTKKVKAVYDAYFDFLNNKSVYTSFEDYLTDNNVDYKFYTLSNC